MVCNYLHKDKRKEKKRKKEGKGQRKRKRKGKTHQVKSRTNQILSWKEKAPRLYSRNTMK